MTYNPEFLDVALKEWRKLSPALREQFKKKLAGDWKIPMFLLPAFPANYIVTKSSYAVLGIVWSIRSRTSRLSFL